MTPSQPARPESFLNHSVSIFLIRFFPSLAALLVMVWFSRHLPEGVYGNYQYFWVQFYICSAVACLGIHAFIITYSPQVLERLLQGLPRLLPVSVLIWIGIAGTGFALLQQASGFSFYTPLLFLFTGACATIAESFLIVYRRFRLLTAGSLLYALLFCLLHWLALEQGISMNNLFLALSVVGAARLCVYLIIILRHRRQAAIAERSVKSDADNDTGNAAAGIRNRRAVRSLWLHMGLYDLVQILFRWVDKLVISLVVSKELFAVYYNGSIEIPFLPLILSAAGSAGLIQLAASGTTKSSRQPGTSDGFQTSGDRQALALLHQSGRILSCFVFPLFFFLLCFRYELFEVVLSSKYLASVPVFLVSLFAIPVRTYSFTTILQHHHKGRIINIGATLDLVIACLLMYPLYLLLGLPGVVLSFVITTYLQAAFYLYHTARILKLPMATLMPLKNWAVKLLLSGALFLSTHILLTWLLPAASALLAGIALLAVSMLLALTLEIRSDRKSRMNDLRE